jgi:transcriptional regulator with XRE-family HTH domain
MDNYCMTPGELLQALLAKRKITANQLAEQLGGGGLQSAMSRLIAGKFRADTLRPVAEYFEIDPLFFRQNLQLPIAPLLLVLNEALLMPPLMLGHQPVKRKIPVVGTAAKWGTTASMRSSAPSLEQATES